MLHVITANGIKIALFVVRYGLAKHLRYWIAQHHEPLGTGISNYIT
jgi:hypothetical protein